MGPCVEKDGSTWKLLGDWTRDLPNQVRYEANQSLESHPLPETLDLTAIGFLDSWGEGRIADLCWEMVQGSITGLPEILRWDSFGLHFALHSHRIMLVAHTSTASATVTWTFTRSVAVPS